MKNNIVRFHKTVMETFLHFSVDNEIANIAGGAGAGVVVDVGVSAGVGVGVGVGLLIIVIILAAVFISRKLKKERFKPYLCQLRLDMLFLTQIR